MEKLAQRDKCYWYFFMSFVWAQCIANIWGPDLRSVLARPKHFVGFGFLSGFDPQAGKQAYTSTFFSHNKLNAAKNSICSQVPEHGYLYWQIIQMMLGLFQVPSFSGEELLWSRDCAWKAAWAIPPKPEVADASWPWYQRTFLDM